MKIPPARQDAFLRAPDPAIVAILFYGPDGGTIRERADQIMRAVVGARSPKSNPAIRCRSS